MAGSSHSGQSLFEQLVEGLASSLQFEAGLTADGNVKRMMQLMDKYVSRESDWRAYAFADYSRAYTRNLVDAGNGESNLVSKNNSLFVELTPKHITYARSSSF